MHRWILHLWLLLFFCCSGKSQNWTQSKWKILWYLIPPLSYSFTRKAWARHGLLVYLLLVMVEARIQHSRLPRDQTPAAVLLLCSLKTGTSICTLFRRVRVTRLELAAYQTSACSLFSSCLSHFTLSHTGSLSCSVTSVSTLCLFIFKLCISMLRCTKRTVFLCLCLLE